MDNFPDVFTVICSKSLLCVCFGPFCSVLLSVLSLFYSPRLFSVRGHLLPVSVCLPRPEPAVPHLSHSVNDEKNGGEHKQEICGNALR